MENQIPRLGYRGRYASMPLVIDSHRETLQATIGARITYGIAPVLHISDSGTYPASECYGQQYGCFFESPLLNLRLTLPEENHSPAQKKWLTLSPGPDEPISEWAPFWAPFSDQPVLRAHVIMDFHDRSYENSERVRRRSTSR